MMILTISDAKHDCQVATLAVARSASPRLVHRRRSAEQSQATFKLQLRSSWRKKIC